MPKDKFGTGQDTCKVCGQQFTDVKILRIKISHSSGPELVDVKYYVPLCSKHRGDGCLDMDITWEATPVPVDQMKAA